LAVTAHPMAPVRSLPHAKYRGTHADFPSIALARTNSSLAIFKYLPFELIFGSKSPRTTILSIRTSPPHPTHPRHPHVLLCPAFWPQVTEFLGCGARQFVFMLKGLQELQPKLEAAGIPFFLLQVSGVAGEYSIV